MTRSTLKNLYLLLYFIHNVFTVTSGFRVMVFYQSDQVKSRVSNSKSVPFTQSAKKRGRPRFFIFEWLFDTSIINLQFYRLIKFFYISLIIDIILTLFYSSFPTKVILFPVLNSRSNSNITSNLFHNKCSKLDYEIHSQEQNLIQDYHLTLYTDLFRHIFVSVLPT